MWRIRSCSLLFKDFVLIETIEQRIWETYISCHRAPLLPYCPRHRHRHRHTDTHPDLNHRHFNNNRFYTTIPIMEAYPAFFVAFIVAEDTAHEEELKSSELLQPPFTAQQGVTAEYQKILDSGTALTPRGRKAVSRVQRGRTEKKLYCSEWARHRIQDDRDHLKDLKIERAASRDQKTRAFEKTTSLDMQW